MQSGIIVLVLISAAGLGTIVLYNRLVHDRERVRQAWSDILVQLKRRHDLVPKLVTAVQAYARYEEQILTEVTSLRARQDDYDQVTQRGALESRLGSKLGNLIAIAEDYPELKANAQWLHLQQNISEVEQDIQSARRYYNGAVKALNVRIDSFPSNLVAGLFGFMHAAFFALDPTGKVLS